MKLHEMNTGQLLRTMSLLAVPLGRIARDQAFETVLRAAQALPDEPDATDGAALLAQALPLAESCRAELLTVAAVLLDEEAEALEAADSVTVLRRVVQSLDEELLRFFGCAAGTERV